MPRGRLMLFDGAKLRALRQERGLTLTQLAALIEALPTSVGRWENGEQKPDPRAALALAHTFDVPIRGLTVVDHGDDERIALAELRLLAGLTSADAAARLGILRKQLSAFENGHAQPEPSLRDDLANLYSVASAEVDAALSRTARRRRNDLAAARERARVPGGGSS